VNKLILIIGAFIFLNCNINSQHLFPVYSQYMLNGLALNPAYAGSRDALNISAGYRNQWVGFEGAPESQTFSMHTPLRNQKVALGLLIFNEQVDVRNNISIFSNYAWRFNTGSGRLALGLKGGLTIRNANWNKVRVHDPGDISFTESSQDIIPNFGFGVYYHTNHFFTGASIPLFLSDSLSNGNVKVYHDHNNYNYLFTSGVVIGRGGFKAKPSILVKYDVQNPVQLDANLSFIFGDFLWIGGSYRIEDTLVGLLKFQVNERLRIGYTYDYSTGALNKYNNGSHEIMIIYDFIYRSRAVNPRYF